MQVMVQQTAHAAMAPSMGGVGGYVHQDAVTVITTHTGARLVIEGMTVRIGGVDISDETAPGARAHDEVAAFWHGQATRWAAEAAHHDEFGQEFAIVHGSDDEARAAVRDYVGGQVAA